MQHKKEYSRSRKLRSSLLFAALAIVCLAFTASTAVWADKDDDDDDDRQKGREMSKTDLAFAEAIKRVTHVHAVEDLVVNRNIKIPYDYIATLMRLPNAFGDGAACVICHSSNDPKKSYRGLDLTSCEGILKGTTEAPVRKIVVPGKPKKGLMRRYLRNNRMPLGVSFNYPQDTENILRVKKWIDDGAKNDSFFQKKVLPLLKAENAFGAPAACTACHMSNQEPPSFHELDMTSHEGIMLGADALAKAEEGLPPVKIVKPGDSAGSKLYQRLVENRMPAGIGPGENRNHPNLQLLLLWIKQGAKCD